MEKKSPVSLLALLVLLAAPALIAERPPNFIVILADDLGYGDIGVYGNQTIRTPNLDAMAQHGVRLTEFYAGAPTCTPSRAALLTGRYPIRSGLVRVLLPKEKWGIPASEITLGDALKGLGYATACIGKWHLGGRKPYRPNKHGFDYYYGVLYSNDMTLLPWVKWPRFELLRDDEVVQSPARVKTLTKLYTEQAVDFIEQNHNRPFFLYLPHTMPHVPVKPSDDFRGRSQHGLYGDVVEELDWSTGEILAALKRQGIDDKTLVIFTSDNGPWVAGSNKKKIKGGSAGPLRGSKGTTWEGGMRVPLIARWPGRLPRGVTRDGIATGMDLFTTIIQTAGGATPRDRVIDGRNILPFLSGEEKLPAQDLFYYFRSRVFAVRSGDWKVHLFKKELNPDGTVRQSVVCDPPELYNLASDVSERHNVASDHPEIVARLAQRAEKFHAAITPAMKLPPAGKSVFRGITGHAPKDSSKVPQ